MVQHVSRNIQPAYKNTPPYPEKVFFNIKLIGATYLILIINKQGE